MTDKLDKTFDELELIADPFLLCELKGQAYMDIGILPKTTLHFVLDGSGQIKINGKRTIDVSRGWILLVPSHHKYEISSVEANVESKPIADLTNLSIERRKVIGEGSGGMVVLCGTVSLGLKGAYELIDLLPVEMGSKIKVTPFIKEALNQILQELSSPKIGSKAIIQSLLLTYLIVFMRDRIKEKDPGIRWISILKEPRLWASIEHMLNDPAANHSLNSLARIAGMSRSRFSATFTMVNGISPMEFLREMRLARAAKLLQVGREPVKRIASLVGFSSRSAFSHAFKAQQGMSPKAYRKQYSS